jgi:hypothetical protein
MLAPSHRRHIRLFSSAANKRFTVNPKSRTICTETSPRGFISTIFCVSGQRRTLRNDSTIAHKGKLYQIQEVVKSKKVLVQERVNGTMLITQNNARLKFKEINARPERQQKPSRIQM